MCSQLKWFYSVNTLTFYLSYSDDCVNFHLSTSEYKVAVLLLEYSLGLCTMNLVWPDLAAGQRQDVVRLLGVCTASPHRELLLCARQQPQQHLQHKSTFKPWPSTWRGVRSDTLQVWTFSTNGLPCVFFGGVGGVERTEVLWDRRLRLAFSGGVNTSMSNGSMWPSSQSQTSWNLEDTQTRCLQVPQTFLLLLGFTVEGEIQWWKKYMN